jgi:hypothetical protein
MSADYFEGDLRSTMTHYGMSDPVHLLPLVSLLERAMAGEKIRACVAAPRQHGKTVVAEWALAWGLARRVMNCALCTYGQLYSGKRSALVVA